MSKIELPDENTLYSQKEYWDERFKTEESFDWFRPYEEFRDMLLSLGNLKPETRILNLGCGTSTLGERLYNDGFKNITNLDFSSVVIEKMKDKHKDKPEMIWKEMDMMNMEFENDSFDVVIEKGTIDAVMVDVIDPWHPQEEIIQKVKLTCKEIHRVLSPIGLFLSITFAQPHFRIPVYEPFEWCITKDTFGETFHYYFYKMEKGKGKQAPQFDFLHKNMEDKDQSESDSDFDDDKDFLTNMESIY